MNNTFLKRALVIAGLVAAGAASAQTMTTDSVTSVSMDDPQTTTTVTTTTWSSPLIVSSTSSPLASSPPNPWVMDAHRGNASATTNYPDRAGEMSTMTNGVPNLLADNNHPSTSTMGYGYIAPSDTVIVGTVPSTSTMGYGVIDMHSGHSNGDILLPTDRQTNK